MAGNQTDNLLLLDLTSGLPRTPETGGTPDTVQLSVDVQLISGANMLIDGGLIVADNFKRGTADPNVALVAGNEGDLYQRTLASTGQTFVNTDGTTTGWEVQVTPSVHESLDQLVHNIAETSYMELTRSSGQVTTATYWTDSGKTTKIRETMLTRTSGQVSTIVATQYDAGGSLVQTLTGTVSRSSGQVASIDWVLT